MSKKLFTMLVACGFFSFSPDLYSSDSEDFEDDNVAVGDLFQDVQDDNDGSSIKSESIGSEAEEDSSSTEIKKEKGKRGKGKRRGHNHKKKHASKAKKTTDSLNATEAEGENFSDNEGKAIHKKDHKKDRHHKHHRKGKRNGKHAKKALAENETADISASE